MLKSVNILTPVVSHLISLTTCSRLLAATERPSVAMAAMECCGRQQLE
jgi:hypothetical protein